MNRFTVFIFLLFCFFIQLEIHSQNRVEDSLKNELALVKSDSLKSSIYHQLYIVNDNLEYAKKNLEYSRKHHYLRGISLAFRDFGRHYYFSEKKDIALNYFNRAVAISLKENDSIALLSSYRYIGYIYMMNDPLVAKEYYLKSLALCRKFNRKNAESYALSALGNVYEGYIKKKSNIKIALDYYLKSLKIREKYGDQEEIAASLNETSRIYFHLGQFEKASELRFKALKIAEKIHSIENLVYLNISIGDDYLKRLKDYPRALNFQLKAYEYCLKQKDNIDKMFDITKAIAICYSKLNNYVLADRFYSMAISYNDSIISRVKIYDYNIAEIKYNLKKELAEHKLLLKDTELLKQKAETARQTSLRNSILIGAVFLLFFAIYIFKSYRSNHKKNIELDLKNQKLQIASDLIEKQKEVAEDNNKKLTQLLIEKELLFKEVHHRVKNNLQIISSLLNLQSNTVTDSITLEALKQSQSRINTMSILHNKLYQTEDFSTVSIVDYLKQLVDSISSSYDDGKCQVFFDVNVDETIVFNLDIAIPFGLILNELITNSFKYAFVSMEKGIIKIDLNKDSNDQVRFIYHDNGVGLAVDFRERAQNSLGLELIEMLSQQLNGTFKIENSSGARFEINFSL